MRPNLAVLTLAACVVASLNGSSIGDEFYGPGLLVIAATTTGDVDIILPINFTGEGAALTQTYGGEFQGGTITLGNSRDTMAALTVDGTPSRVTLIPEGPSSWITGAYLWGAGDHVAIFARFGDVGTWSYRIGAGASNVTEWTVTQFPEADVVSLEACEFRAQAFVLGAGAVATTPCIVEFDIDHTLVGWFLLPPTTSHVHAGVVTLEGPNGTDTCPCYFYEETGPESRGPGHYRLTWTGATTSAIHSVLGAWVDVDVSS